MLHSFWETQDLAIHGIHQIADQHCLPAATIFSQTSFTSYHTGFEGTLYSCAGRSAAELSSMGISPYLVMGLPTLGNALEFHQVLQNLFNHRELMAGNTVSQCKAGYVIL